MCSDNVPSEKDIVCLQKALRSIETRYVDLVGRVGTRFTGILDDVTLASALTVRVRELNAQLDKTIVENAAITEALYREKERAQITLNSIGDAVICTDVSGLVTYLNSAAERLTGWRRDESLGKPFESIFHIIASETGVLIPNPMRIATVENKVVGLPPFCTLIRRDGTEIAIEDSTAPIHDRDEHVTGAVMVFHDVSVARSLSIKLSHAAHHDELTGLPNRNLLNDRLTLAIAAASRHRHQLAVLYLDIDRFKNINDSLGHAVGDKLLQAVGYRLSECVRATDTVSRQGGDEFVVLLAQITQAEDAAICAEKILQSIRAAYLLEGQEVHVAASIGLVIYPQDGVDGQSLLKNADSAMYEAKARGRNHFQFYRKELNARASERQTLESALRHAVERREFELYYQPIVDINSGDIAGVEALIRWRHPIEGFILPIRFIPIAEESGLIVHIGRWVLREACRQASAWNLAGSTEFRLAVNISAVELRSHDFVAGVAAILHETGFDPARLDLELTETFLMHDSKSTAKVLLGLKALGIRLALDDFGTGYSSLSYMRRFPIDALKIDRSFVNGLDDVADDASVVSAVIIMGRSLNMRVVAEGVETREQLAFLRAQGCVEAQGNFFSRPLTAAGIGKLMGHTTHPA